MSILRHIHRYNTRRKSKDLKAIIKIQKQFRYKLIKNRIRRLGKYKQCVICLDYIYTKKITYLESCDHIFHKGCINKWKQIEHICPICREKIPIENKKTKSLFDIIRKIFGFN